MRCKSMMWDIALTMEHVLLDIMQCLMHLKQFMLIETAQVHSY